MIAGVHISIHALREEGDILLGILLRVPLNFYPRPPRGGRPKTALRRMALRYFYPRPPRGGRLGFQLLYGGLSQISIHALREEGD